MPRAVLHDARGRGGGVGSDRTPRARGARRRIAAGASSEGGRGRMSEGPAALAALLTALAPPLEFLAGDDFRAAARTSLPLDAIDGRLAEAKAGVRDPSTRRALDALGDLIGRLGTAPPEGRAALLREAHALLPALRAAVEGEPAARADYAGGGAEIAAALAALRAPVERVAGVGPKRAPELARFGI